jgi:hypothetical protein
MRPPSPQIENANKSGGAVHLPRLQHAVQRRFASRSPESERKTVTIQGQFVVIREAIDVVLRHLERLPSSDTTERLQLHLQDCMQETEMWSTALPTRRELDAVMKRVLALHIEVTRVEREAAGTRGGAVTA